MEAFSSQGDGTLTVVKEDSPTSFSVEQTVATPARAKVLTLDTKTNRILTITAEYGPHAGSAAASRPAAAAGPTGGPPSGMPAFMRGPRPPMIPARSRFLSSGSDRLNRRSVFGSGVNKTPGAHPFRVLCGEGGWPVDARALYSVQFSILSPGTRPNSRVLLVTSVSPRQRACAAMSRSFAPMMIPRGLRKARTCA